ncbi:hypothetical protein DY000_02022380 [Brassica cretica]|uniref:Uncharacterized protein n=1 Tax=Brassica cretica TaxID=69181 RepID=A0ABQ7E339_BRACR|nr:hypothetical protein DY000_02022380 [Brassica cretica]
MITPEMHLCLIFQRQPQAKKFLLSFLGKSSDTLWMLLPGLELDQSLSPGESLKALSFHDMAKALSYFHMNLIKILLPLGFLICPTWSSHSQLLSFPLLSSDYWAPKLSDKICWSLGLLHQMIHDAYRCF